MKLSPLAEFLIVMEPLEQIVIICSSIIVITAAFEFFELPLASVTLQYTSIRFHESLAVAVVVAVVCPFQSVQLVENPDFL